MKKLTLLIVALLVVAAGNAMAWDTISVYNPSQNFSNVYYPLDQADFVFIRVNTYGAGTYAYVIDAGSISVSASDGGTDGAWMAAYIYATLQVSSSGQTARISAFW